MNGRRRKALPKTFRVARGVCALQRCVEEQVGQMPIERHSLGRLPLLRHRSERGIWVRSAKR